MHLFVRDFVCHRSFDWEKWRSHGHVKIMMFNIAEKITGIRPRNENSISLQSICRNFIRKTKNRRNSEDFRRLGATSTEISEIAAARDNYEVHTITGKELVYTHVLYTPCVPFRKKTKKKYPKKAHVV